MTELKHILFPVDYSPRSNGTVPFIKEMARRHNAQVTLLSVIETPSPMTEAAHVIWPPAPYDSAGQRKVGQARIEDFEREHFADLASVLKIHSCCEFGDAALTIAGHAESIRADLIMMPTHGYGKYRALLIGSVTAKVLHDAHCPVWTGAHLEEGTSLDHVQIRNILCAIDLSRESRSLTSYSMGLARVHSAAVRLIHSVPDAETRSEEFIDEKIQAVLSEAAQEEMILVEREAGTEVQVRMEGESISKMVRKAALHYHSNLVVIGRGKLQSPFGRLRTHAYAIIRDSPCPVLSV